MCYISNRFFFPDMATGWRVLIDREAHLLLISGELGMA